MSLTLYAVVLVLSKAAEGAMFPVETGRLERSDVAERLNVTVDMGINCKGSLLCHFESKGAAEDLVGYIASLPAGVFYPDGTTIGVPGRIHRRTLLS